MNLLRGLAHDLRAPLQTLLGNVDLLCRGHFGELTAAQAEALAAVSRSAERILAVAEDVLAVARIDAGQEPAMLAEVALDELLEREVADARPAAERKGLELELHCPEGLKVVSDGPKLARIVQNLVSNAIEYTATGGVVVSGGAWGVAVEDTGIGIAREKQELVFEEYVRLDTNRPGTGLGLAIVKRLAVLIHAALSLESEPGRGTVVRLELPRGPGGG